MNFKAKAGLVAVLVCATCYALMEFTSKASDTPDTDADVQIRAEAATAPVFPGVSAADNAVLRRLVLFVGSSATEDVSFRIAGSPSVERYRGILLALHGCGSDASAFFTRPEVHIFACSLCVSFQDHPWFRLFAGAEGDGCCHRR